MSLHQLSGRVLWAVLVLCYMASAVAAPVVEETVENKDAELESHSEALTSDAMQLEIGGFWEGAGKSAGMILATEMGDRTFFIAAIMAMAHSRWFVFLGAMAANAVMTVLGAAIGFGLPAFVHPKYTRLFAALLFLYFGLMMLREAYKERGEATPDDLEEAEEEIAKLREKKAKSGKRVFFDELSEDDEERVEINQPPSQQQQQQQHNEEQPKANGQTSTNGSNGGSRIPDYKAVDSDSGAVEKGRALQTGGPAGHAEQSQTVPALSENPAEVFTMLFSLTFFGEWGDRSQIATIALAAAQNVYGVIVGAIIGHSVCTAIAVIGGRFLAAKFSETMVKFFGGILFIVFAGMTLILHDD